MSNKRLLPAIFAVALLASACSSSDTPESLAAVEDSPTTTAQTQLADDVPEQVSAEAEPIGLDDPEPSNELGTDAPPIEETVTPGDEPRPEPEEEQDPEPVDPPQESVEPVEPATCDAPSEEIYFVDVAIDDPDGGLNVRDDAGVSSEILGVLPFNSLVFTTGECAVANGSDWWEIQSTVRTTGAWVSSSFLSDERLPTPGLGAREDDAENRGLMAETFDEIVETIADSYGFDSDRTITQVDSAGIDASSAEGTYDITGLKDDSVSGYRVAIGVNFLTDDDGENILGLEVFRVSRWPICARGVSDDLVCI